MPSRHGTRRCYGEGCRCKDCKAANAKYQRDLRNRHATGAYVRPPVWAPLVSPTPDPPAEPAGPGSVEVAVLSELDGLAQATVRPGLVQTALALARLLDSKQAMSMHPAAAGKLADILDRLRKGADARRSRLASVRQMTQPVEWPGS